jgi:hypothetical protein
MDSMGVACMLPALGGDACGSVTLVVWREKC